MKQQDITQQLGSLINQTNGVFNTVTADESIPSELQEPDPLFEIDYKNEQSVARHDAMTTVEYIVKSVVPGQYSSDEMMVNKMKLDATQLGSLYYQQMLNNKALEAAMDVLSKGDTQPRMFEVIDKLQKRASDLSAQITDTQNQFRKYYIDSYLDIESKRKAEEADNGVLGPSKQIEKKNKEQIEISEDGNVKTISSKQTVMELNRLKMERAKKKKQQETQDIEYQEI